MRAQAQENEKCTTTHTSDRDVSLESIRDRFLPGEMIKAKVTESS